MRFPVCITQEGDNRKLSVVALLQYSNTIAAFKNTDSSSTDTGGTSPRLPP